MTQDLRHVTNMQHCWQVSAIFMTSSTSSKLRMLTRLSTLVLKASSSSRPVSKCAFYRRNVTQVYSIPTYESHHLGYCLFKGCSIFDNFVTIRLPEPTKVILLVFEINNRALFFVGSCSCDTRISHSPLICESEYHNCVTLQLSPSRTANIITISVHFFHTKVDRLAVKHNIAFLAKFSQAFILFLFSNGHSATLAAKFWYEVNSKFRLFVGLYTMCLELLFVCWNSHYDILNK